MSNSKALSKQRTGTKINTQSLPQEKDLIKALKIVENKLKNTFPNLILEHDKDVYNQDIVDMLVKNFPNETHKCNSKDTYIRPDGGFYYFKDKCGDKRFILISEAKRQGTNNEREIEGKKKQAKGNAVERLAKNVMASHSLMRNERITPLVTFLQGCDFEAESTIIDRISPMAGYKPLNQINLNDGEKCKVGSFYVRESIWTIKEMVDIMFAIAERSLYYYFANGIIQNDGKLN